MQSRIGFNFLPKVVLKERLIDVNVQNVVERFHLWDASYIAHVVGFGNFFFINPELVQSSSVFIFIGIIISRLRLSRCCLLPPR